MICTCIFTRGNTENGESVHVHALLPWDLGVCHIALLWDLVCIALVCLSLVSWSLSCIYSVHTIITFMYIHVYIYIIAGAPYAICTCVSL